jgi:hypothetical protein
MLANLLNSTSTPSALVTDARGRIRDAARKALQASGYRAVAQLGCDVRDGVVVLSGYVSSYYLKQVAQESVLRLKLDCGLENGIVVQRG